MVHLMFLIRSAADPLGEPAQNTMIPHPCVSVCHTQCLCIPVPGHRDQTERRTIPSRVGRSNLFHANYSWDSAMREDAVPPSPAFLHTPPKHVRAPEISCPTQRFPSSLWDCLVTLPVSAQVWDDSSQLSFGLSSVLMPFYPPHIPSKVTSKQFVSFCICICIILAWHFIHSLVCVIPS